MADGLAAVVPSPVLSVLSDSSSMAARRRHHDGVVPRMRTHDGDDRMEDAEAGLLLLALEAGVHGTEGRSHPT